MTPDENLRNMCRQIEQQYVSWRQPATYNGYRIVRDWPAIGELGRYRLHGVQVRFVTTNSRSVEVQSSNGAVLATYPMKPGLAEKLYAAADEAIRVK